MTGDDGDSETVKFLHAIRQVFIPNRVLIRLNPKEPPRELAKLNGTLRALADDDLSTVKPNVRLCENFTCGLPIYDPQELKLA